MAGFGAKVRLSVDKSAAAKSEFNNQVQAIVKDVKIKITPTVTKQTISQLRSNIQSELSAAPIKITKIDCSSAVNKLRKDLQNVINSLSIKNGVNIKLADPSGSGGIATNIRDVSAAADSGAAKVAEYTAQLKVLEALEETLDKNVKAAFTGKNQITDPGQVAHINAEYSELIRQINSLKDGNVVDTKKTSQLVNFGALLRKNINLWLEMGRVAANTGATEESSAEKPIDELEKKKQIYIQINNLIKQIDGNLMSWTKAKHGKTKNEYANLTKLRDDLVVYSENWDKFDLSTLKSALDNGKTSASEYNTKIKLAHENTKSFGDRMSGLAGKFGVWTSITSVIMATVRAIKKMVSTIIELDDAMTQMRIVTRASEAELTSYEKKVVATANELGASIADLNTYGTTYARLGYNLDESQLLAKYTAMLQKVGDIDITTAQNAITAIVKAFDVNIEDLELTMDKMVMVGNNFPISVVELAEGMNNASSSLAAAGNSYEQSLALLTAANTTVQNISKASTGLRTITARIRNTKTELDDLGETMSSADYEGIVAALSDHNVALTDAKGEYRSTYDIIEDIANVWEQLTGMEQAAIAETLAGTRQQNIFYSLIEQFQEASGAMDRMGESAGTMQESYDIYMDSITAHINQFKTAFQMMSKSALSEDLISFFVDFGTVLIKILTGVFNLIDALGGLGLVLTTTGSIIASLNIFKIAKLFSGSAGSATKIGVGIQNIIMDFQLLADSFQEARLSGGGFTSVIKGTMTAMYGTQAAAVGLTAALTAVVAIIGIAIAAHQRHKQKLEEQRQAAEDAANAYQEGIASLEEYKNKIVELRREIDYGNLSEEDAYNKRKELISIQEELIKKFGKEAEGISLVTGEINNQIDAINRLSEADYEKWQRQNYDAIDSAIDLFTEFDPSKIDLWNAPINGGFAISAPSSGELWDGIEDLGLEINPKNFYDKLGAELVAANIGIEIPVAGITGDFVSNLDIDSVYEALDVYESIYDITEKLGKEYFGENYMSYVGTALSGLSKQINSITKAIENNEATFNTYATGQLNYNTQYSDIWGKMLAAKQKYDEAVLNGDDEAVSAAVAQMQQVQTEWAKAGWSNEAVNLYVQNFFDQFSDLSKQYQLELKIKPDLDNPDGKFKQQVQDIVDVFQDENGKIDLYKILNIGQEYEQGGFSADSTELSEEQEAYIDLIKVTNKYGVEVEDLIQVLGRLGVIQLENAETANETATKYANLTKRLDDIAVAEDSVGKLTDVMKEFQENGVASAASIIGLSKAFGSLESWDNFVHVLSDVNSSEADVQNAASKLATEYLKQLGILDDLSDSEAALIEGLLKERGVTVDIISVQDKENAALWEEKIAKASLVDTTWASVEAFLAESGAGEEVISTVQRLRVAEYNAAVATTDFAKATAESIEKLIQQAKAAASGVEQIAVLTQILRFKEIIEDPESDRRAKQFAGSRVDAILKAHADDLDIEDTEINSGLFDINIPDTDSGSTAIEEYVAEIEKYRKELFELEKAQSRASKLEFGIDDTDDIEERIALREQLIGAYKEEQSTLNALNNARDIDIAENIAELEKRGIHVQYDPESNELYIENLEDINKLTASTQGEYESMQEATNAYREETEELINTTIDLNDANKENSERWWDLRSKISKTKDSIVDDLNEMVKAANDVVDGFQNVYSTLTNAAKEYMSTGYLSVDSLQSILELGPQYLTYLIDENEQLIINRDSLQDLIAAKVEDMTVTTALSHVRQILEAIENGNINDLNALTLATASNTESTWDNVFALLDEARAMATVKGISTEFYDDTYASFKKMQSLSTTATSTIGYSLDALKDDYVSWSDGLTTIFDLTKEMIRWENEQEIDNLNDELDAITDIIERRKELIQLNKEEDDHNKDVAEKLKEIAKLQARIDTLKLDDSREAAAERASLEEELYGLQSDLADMQADYAVDAQVDALDKQLEDYEDFNNDKIDELEDTLSSEEKLYRATIDRIEKGWDALYDDLIRWNYNYGTELENNLVDAWGAAKDAASEYGSLVAAMTGVNNSHIVSGGLSSNSSPKDIKRQMIDNSIAWFTTVGSASNAYKATNNNLASIYSSITGNTLKYNNGSWLNEDGTTFYDLYSDDEYRNRVALAVVKEMQQRAEKWHTADSATQKTLAAENVELAAKIQSFLGRTIVKDTDGVWHIDGINGQPLFEVKKFHTGGIAGDRPTLKQDEVMSILKKGEPVLGEDHEKGLYRIIDFTQMLSEKLGRVIDTSKLGSFFMNRTTMPALAALGATPGHSEQSYTFNPVVNVNISHNGTMTDADARRYGSIAADSVLQELKDTFTRRGITRIGNAILK